MDHGGFREHVAASTAAGVCSTLLCHPLDTIKTHLQAAASNHTYSSNKKIMPISTSSSWTVAQHIGVRGLWQGMAPSLINAIVIVMVRFHMFDQVDKAVDNVVVAGMASGMATAMVSTPTDWVKIQAQLSSSSASSSGSKSSTSSSRQVLWNLLQQQKSSSLHKNTLHPLQRLYQGHVANMGREGVFTILYLGLYHNLIHNWNHDNHHDNSNSRHEDDNFNKNKKNMMQVALTSSMTGALAWIVHYPLDTIKTLRQSGQSYRQIHQLFASQGWSLFYQGCATSTGRAMMMTSSRMIAYESCTQFLLSQQ